MAIKNKKLTRSEITEKILKKYEVNEENLDFQTLKYFKEKMKETNFFCLCEKNHWRRKK